MTNPHNRFFLAAISIMLLMLMSCKTVTIRTILHSDAGIHREITVSGDSSGVDETAYPFSLREPWVLTKKQDDKDSTKYTFTISSNFAKIDDLNKELDYQADSIKVNALAKLDKKFRWFYSYYHYEEIFFSFFPFNKPPLRDILTPGEFQLYQSGADSSDINDKVEKYAQANFFKTYSRALLRAIDKHPDLGLHAADIENHKQELFQILDDSMSSSDELMTSALTATDSLLQPNGSLLDIRYEFADLDSTLNQYMAFLEKIIGEDYRVEVVMPGHVFDTNANNTITKKMAVWEFDSERFHLADYTLWVDSRQLNIIPTAITTLIFLLSILSFYLSTQSNRRRALEAKGVAWKDRKRFILFWPLSIVLIIVGICLTVFFAYLYIVFNAEPEFQFLDFFSATPADNALYISLQVLGLLMILFGGSQLIRFFRKGKNDKLHKKAASAEDA